MSDYVTCSLLSVRPWFLCDLLLLFGAACAKIITQLSHNNSMLTILILTLFFTCLHVVRAITHPPLYISPPSNRHVTSTCYFINARVWSFIDAKHKRRHHHSLVGNLPYYTHGLMKSQSGEISKN